MRSNETYDGGLHHQEEPTSSVFIGLSSRVKSLSPTSLTDFSKQHSLIAINDRF